MSDFSQEPEEEVSSYSGCPDARDGGAAAGGGMYKGATGFR